MHTHTSRGATHGYLVSSSLAAFLAHGSSSSLQPFGKPL